MVVVRPVGTSIPVGPVSEQNPALSVNCSGCLCFRQEVVAWTPRFARPDSRGGRPYVVHLFFLTVH